MFAAALMLCLPAAAEKQKDIYMFGVATNFKDSVAYITTIQRVDSAILRRGSGMLAGRSLYSTQLKRYAENQFGKFHEVPVIFFDTNQSKLEKKYHKVVKNIKGTGALFLRELTYSDFRFTPVSREKIIEQGHVIAAPAATDVPIR